jgi:hypothetical protein
MVLKKPTGGEMAAYVIAELGATEQEAGQVARLIKTGVGIFGEKMLADSCR